METVQLAKKTVSLQLSISFIQYLAIMLLQKKGAIIHVTTRRELKPIINSKTGYCHVNICDKSLEKPKNYYVHRFVYESTKGVIPEGFEINHINARNSYL